MTNNFRYSNWRHPKVAGLLPAIVTGVASCHCDQDGEEPREQDGARHLKGFTKGLHFLSPHSWRLVGGEDGMELTLVNDF